MKKTFVLAFFIKKRNFKESILKFGGDNGDPAPEPESDEEGSPEPSYPQDDRY